VTFSESGDYDEAHKDDSGSLGHANAEQLEEVIDDSDDDDSDYLPDEDESFSSFDDDDYETESFLSSGEDQEPAAPEEVIVEEESEGESIAKDAVPVQESRYPIKRDNRRVNQNVNVTQASVPKRCVIALRRLVKLS
jgi:hypothetical protein